MIVFGTAAPACHPSPVEIPRPDLDSLLWLTAREQWRATEPPAPREPLHAVRGSKVFCGYEEPIDIQRVLWIDSSVLSYIDGPEPCSECSNLTHRRANDPTEMVEIYGARSSTKNSALIEHIKRLEPEILPRTIWEYRVDVGRAQFDDEIGDFFSIWRTVRPVKLPPMPLDPKRLP